MNDDMPQGNPMPDAAAGMNEEEMTEEEKIAAEKAKKDAEMDGGAAPAPTEDQEEAA